MPAPRRSSRTGRDSSCQGESRDMGPLPSLRGGKKYSRLVIGQRKVVDIHVHTRSGGDVGRNEGESIFCERLQQLSECVRVRVPNVDRVQFWSPLHPTICRTWRSCSPHWRVVEERLGVGISGTACPHTKHPSATVEGHFGSTVRSFVVPHHLSQISVTV